MVPTSPPLVPALPSEQTPSVIGSILNSLAVSVHNHNRMETDGTLGATIHDVVYSLHARLPCVFTVK